ncbi:MAG: hypothetical protein KGZ88_15300 [Methylomicrobium sp.]|nr:hypothetical protein [Methylomicrobium sp.]
MTPPTATPISAAIVQLGERIAQALGPETTGPGAQREALLYIGHWQDAIPRAIWSDPDLEAIDVRCWGLMRTQTLTGSAVLLSLHRLLHSHLGIAKPTVSKVLYVLRLTRWLSLCSALRTPTGQFKGHVYAVHDHRLALTDALYLDPEYLDFVNHQRRHHQAQIRTLARQIWQAIDHREEPPSCAAVSDFFQQVNGQRQVQIINLADDRVQKLNPVPKPQVQKVNLAKINQVQKMNLAQTDQVQKLNLANPKQEPKEKPKEKQSLIDEVQKLNRSAYITTTTSSSCSSSFLNKFKITTTTPVSANREKNLTDAARAPLSYPPSFNASEQALAQRYLNPIDPELHQALLDETAAQIDAKRTSHRPIRNPLAYLSWLCQEHAKGHPVLTSLSIRYRDNRERQQRTEQQVRNHQQELAALSGRNAPAENPKKRHDKPQKSTKPTQQLREALNNAHSDN